MKTIDFNSIDDLLPIDNFENMYYVDSKPIYDTSLKYSISYLKYKSVNIIHMIDKLKHYFTKFFNNDILDDYLIFIFLETIYNFGTDDYIDFIIDLHYRIQVVMSIDDQIIDVRKILHIVFNDKTLLLNEIAIFEKQFQYIDELDISQIKYNKPTMITYTKDVLILEVGIYTIKGV